MTEEKNKRRQFETSCKGTSKVVLGGRSNSNSEANNENSLIYKCQHRKRFTKSIKCGISSNRKNVQRWYRKLLLDKDAAWWLHQIAVRQSVRAASQSFLEHITDWGMQLCTELIETQPTNALPWPVSSKEQGRMKETASQVRPHVRIPSSTHISCNGLGKGQVQHHARSLLAQKAIHHVNARGCGCKGSQCKLAVFLVVLAQLFLRNLEK